MVALGLVNNKDFESKPKKKRKKNYGGGLSCPSSAGVELSYKIVDTFFKSLISRANLEDDWSYQSGWTELFQKVKQDSIQIR